MNPLPSPGRHLPAPLLALLLVLPLTVAAPSVPGGLSGAGTVTDFQVFSDPGYAVQGGAYDWTLACGECRLVLAIASGGFTLVQNGAVTNLAPGTYEIREFRGVFAYDARGPHDFVVLVDGVGVVHAWA